MSIFENMKMALSSLFAHKMRSILTMLGIIIGVGSVITVVSIGQGGEAMLKSQFSGAENTTEIYYELSDEEMDSNPNEFLESTFTEKDIRLVENIPEVQRVIKSSTENSQVRYYEEYTDGNIKGVSEEYMDVNLLETKSGRSLNAEDFLAGNRSAIISESFRKKLFDGNKMLGEVVYIGPQPVKIVGVLEEEKSIFETNTDTIYLSIKTWQSIFASSDINELSIQSKTSEKLKTAGGKAVDILNRVSHKEGSYKILNQEEIAESISQVTNIMTIVIGSIAGVSLFVGGIGVMNIMLVSVTERTREIGIRMSLGATRGQILVQFLIESITLTLFGGMIGMLFGIGAAMLVSYFAGWPYLISLPIIIGGLLFSMLIGIIFGIMPANKAARKDPIQALGHE